MTARGYDVPSLLTPTPGYRLTVVQYVGARPDGLLDCTLCTYTDRVTLPLEARPGDVDELAASILTGITRWTSHRCPSRAQVLSDPTTSYPQESPAPERTRSYAEGHQGD